MIRTALQAVAAAALALTLWAACAGVGSWILPRARADRPDDSPPDWNRPGVAACIGLGVLLALGGLGTALHIPIWLTAGAFLIVGLVLALVRLLGVSWRPGPWITIALPVGTVAAFGLIAVVESQMGMRAQINPCDELRAYLPMVHRLIDTNAIIEPWSYRRVQNLGGFTYLQALPVRVFGNIAIGLAEFLIGAVFLGGLFVSGGFRSTWTRVLGLLFILTIPILWIPRINVAPVLLTVPLLVAAFGGTAQIRTALRNGDRSATLRWAIGCGVLLAGIASVRAPTMPVAAAVVALGAAIISGPSIRDRARAIAVAAGSAIVAIGPWLIASWESVNTPLYPFIAGNANTAVPSERDPALDTLGELASNTWSFLTAGSFFWLVLTVLLFAFLARRVLPDAPLVAIIAITTLAAIFAFSVTLSIASDRDFGRYIAPMAEALAVFVFYETLRALDAATLVTHATRAVRGPALAVAFGVVALGAVFSPLAVIPAGDTVLLPASWNLLRWSSTTPGFVRANHLDNLGLEREFNEALRHVDPRHTIVAVDRPYLVDYDRYDLPNMDLPGWATPTGDFPFFQGPEVKIAALQREGFTHLIMTEPARERCLDPNYLRYERLYLDPPDSTYARYFLNWLNDMAFVEHNIAPAVTRLPHFVVIDLKRARQAFRDARAQLRADAT